MTLNNNSIVAPIYRYFMTDLLSNSILMEIPYGSVSWQRAIDSAGSFQGVIPVIDKTAAMSLYNNTLPGITGLYVIRNGKCVWGGIVWDRSYELVGQQLSVNGLEFSSYFDHRLVWRTNTFSYLASVQVVGGVCNVSFNSGEGQVPTLVPKAPVFLTFDDSVVAGNSTYDNYYTIATSPAPTTNTFTTTTNSVSADVVAISRFTNVVTVLTSNAHGYNTGDIVTVSTGSIYDGSFSITAVNGPTSTTFTYVLGGSDSAFVAISGTVVRPIPDGVYTNTTVTVAADVHQYVRNLVTAVFNDFTGIDFETNTTLDALAMSDEVNIISVQVNSGIATMGTDTPHGLATGETVTISGVGSPFDGIKVITGVLDPQTFTYASGGTVAHTSIAPAVSTVITRAIGLSPDPDVDSFSIVTMTTSSAHGFRPNQTVVVNAGSNIDGFSSNYSGEFVIESIPTSTSFTYFVPSASDSYFLPVIGLSPVTLTDSTTTANIVSAKLTGNVVTLQTDFNFTVTGGGSPVTFTTGNSVTITNLAISAPISDMQYVATPGSTSGVATIVTTNPHPFSVGDSVSIVGSKNNQNVLSRVITEGTGGQNFQTITTANPHNFKVGDKVNIVNCMDIYEPVSYSITSNTATVSYPTNQIQSGTPVTLSNITTSLQPTSYSIAEGTMSLFFSSAHGLVVNDDITLANTSETVSTVSYVIVNGVVTYTTSTYNNLTAGDTVLYWPGSGLFGSNGPGDPPVVLAATPTTVSFQQYVQHVNEDGTLSTETDTDTTSNIPKTAYSSTFYVFPTVYNNQFTVSVVPDSLTVQFPIDANDVVPTTFTISVPNGVLAPQLQADSPINGTFTTTAVDVGTIAFSVVAPNAGTTTILYPTQDSTTGEWSGPFPTVSTPSNLNNTIQTITSITPTTFSFTASVNLFSNGSGRGTTSGYTISGTGSLGQDSGRDTYFQASGTVVSGAGGVNIETMTLGTGKLQPGTVYTFSATVIASAGSGPAISFLPKVQVAGTGLLSSSQTVSPVAGFTRISITFTTFASGSVTFSVLNTGASMAAGNVVAFRDAQMEIGSVATTYGAVGSMAMTGVGFTSTFFLGAHTISAVSPTSFSFTMTGPSVNYNYYETPTNIGAYAFNTSILSGTYTLTGATPSTGQVTYAKTHANIPQFTVSGTGTATVRPLVISNTYGPYSGNSSLGVTLDGLPLSGNLVTPPDLIGSDLNIVSDIINDYAGLSNGFDYRIDCNYDLSSDSFQRKFILLPLTFPDAPALGQVSDPSRFGADKIVFEYPGNIIDVTLDESADTAATRFFSVGDSSLVQDGQSVPYAAATADDLLNAERAWPLLDDTENVTNVIDPNALYSFASQSLNESRPPYASLTVQVDGSLEPTVDTYSPGDWCSLNIDDPFIQMRLQSGLEPRDTVLVRKIDSYTVTVPDGTTFPETVDLVLVSDIDVDTFITTAATGNGTSIDTDD